MLLSLLSRRTLEADSRDSYGFAVRPQHLHTYRQYGNIYKEEEEERSGKWMNFLQQFPDSSASNEYLESPRSKDLQTNPEIVPEKLEAHSSKEGENEKGSPQNKQTKRLKKIKTWGPIRPSLDAIEKLMRVDVNNVPNTGEEHVSPKQKHLSSIDEELQERKDKIALEDRDGHGEGLEDLDDNQGMVGTLDSSYQEKDECDKVSNSKKDSDNVTNLKLSKPYYSWKGELLSLVQGGVPKFLRGEVWQVFVGVQIRRKEIYYRKLLSVQMDPNDKEIETWKKIEKQIEKDLPRTFPGHPALDEEGRNSLRRILTAYARHNPSVGYCQAMNFFAGLFLLLMPEENAFWTLVGVIEDYFDGCYTQEMIESQVDQLVFEDLMREKFPKLVNHLDYLGVEVAWISGAWFLSIFMNMLPWESVLRVWDVLLFEGNRVMLFRTALAIMELYGPALITTKDAGDAVTLLQSLTGSTFDSSQLVHTACMNFLTVTQDTLEKLRRKHRPSVLGIVDEETTGSPLSENSKSIATKLCSFKQDAQSLIKESSIKESSDRKLNKSLECEVNSSPHHFDEFMCGLNIDSLSDLQEQVTWLKVELCRLMEENRLATLRAEELETAFLEMVKQDNRRELSARIEQLEQEVALLQQTLEDKQEQERAMFQVLIHIEQEQKDTEDARVIAQQTAHALQEKYDKAMTSLAEMEKRMRMAESMLEATIQYESGQAKAQASPRCSRPPESPQTGIRIGLLPFGLGWRDRNKARSTSEEDLAVDREA